MNNDIEIFRKKLDIKAATAAFKQMEQVSCPVTHHFADGQYVRETFMPAGTLVIGKKHRTEVINILLKGKIIVYMGEDEPIRELTAPCIFPTDAGVQKIGYIKEDVIWANCHPTEHKDLEKIEQDVIIGDDEDLLLYCSDDENNTEEHH